MKQILFVQRQDEDDVRMFSLRAAETLAVCRMSEFNCFGWFRLRAEGVFSKNFFLDFPVPEPVPVLVLLVKNMNYNFG